MGVYGGAAAHFDLKLPAARLFVETGYGAALNVHPTLCSSGPYCWQHDLVLNGLSKLGLKSTLLYNAFTHSPFDAEDMTAIKKAASSSLVYIMSMEFQLVIEVQEDEFKFALPWGPDVPVCLKMASFEDLLQHKVENVFGWVQIEKVKPLAQDECFRTGLECAIEMYSKPACFPYEGYTFGLPAYEVWLASLTKGEYDQHGHWWNAMVWSECRSQYARYFEHVASMKFPETDELVRVFGEIAAHLVTSSDKELEDSKKVECIRQAYALEQLVPPLLQEVLSKTEVCGFDGSIDRN